MTREGKLISSVSALKQVENSFFVFAPYKIYMRIEGIYFVFLVALRANENKGRNKKQKRIACEQTALLVL